MTNDYGCYDRKYFKAFRPLGVVVTSSSVSSCSLFASLFALYWKGKKLRRIQYRTGKGKLSIKKTYLGFRILEIFSSSESVIYFLFWIPFLLLWYVSKLNHSQWRNGSIPGCIGWDVFGCHGTKVDSNLQDDSRRSRNDERSREKFYWSLYTYQNFKTQPSCFKL